MSSSFSPNLYDYADFIRVRFMESGGARIQFTGYLDEREPKNVLALADASLLIGTHTDRVHEIHVRPDSLPQALTQAALALIEFTPAKNGSGLNRIYCLEAISQAYDRSISPENENKNRLFLELEYEALDELLTFDIR